VNDLSLKSHVSSFVLLWVDSWFVLVSWKKQPLTDTNQQEKTVVLET